MKSLLFLFVVSFLSTSFADVIATSKFTDPLGNKWTRWVQTAKAEDGQLLLVVENPDKHLEDETLSQQVVHRKVYANSSRAEFLKAQSYYQKLLDLPLREKTYYSKLNAKINSRNEPLWNAVKEDWSWQDEENFIKWYKATVTADFAKGHGVKFDCADFGIFVRWIYAHDNRLPVANSISGSSKLFGNWSGSEEWDNLKTNKDWRKDERFKAAMHYLFNNIYTHSIFNDLYPVKLDRQFVNSTTVILSLYSSTSGHTQVINRIGAECNGRDCITALYGNEPANDVGYEDSAWFDNKRAEHGGFMRFRWPVKRWYGWKLKDKEDMPGYSMEQYAYPNLQTDEYIQLVYEKLGLNSSPLNKAFSALESMTSQLRQRINLTAMGHFVCHVQKCDLDSQLYNDYSTPSRDLRFHESRSKFFQYVAYISKEEMHWIDSALNNLDQEEILNSSYSFKDFIMNRNNVADNMKSDPRVSLFERWGLSGMNESKKISMLTYTWSYVFGNFRNALVNVGYMACYPNGATKPSCNKSDEKIKSFITDRLDAALKKVRAEIFAAYPKLPGYVQEDLAEISSDFFITKNEACDSNELNKGSCYAFDFLFLQNDWVSKMTSNPWDSLKRRWGLE